MIQNGGDTPRSSVRSVLTINHPNTTHMGTYFCSAGGRTSTIHFQVVEGRLQCMILPITSLCYSNSGIIGIDIMQPGIQVHTSSCLLGEHCFTNAAVGIYTMLIPACQMFELCMKCFSGIYKMQWVVCLIPMQTNGWRKYMLLLAHVGDSNVGA